MKDVFDWYTAIKPLWIKKYFKWMDQSLFTIKDVGNFNPLMPGGNNKVTDT